MPPVSNNTQNQFTKALEDTNISTNLQSKYSSMIHFIIRYKIFWTFISSRCNYKSYPLDREVKVYALEPNYLMLWTSLTKITIINEPCYFTTGINRIAILSKLLESIKVSQSFHTLSIFFSMEKKRNLINKTKLHFAYTPSVFLQQIESSHRSLLAVQRRSFALKVLQKKISADKTEKRVIERVCCSFVIKTVHFHGC